MSISCAPDVGGRFLCGGDTSNKPFEWTGRHNHSATPPQAPCLPLKGSVRQAKEPCCAPTESVLGGESSAEQCGGTGPMRVVWGAVGSNIKEILLETIHASVSGLS